MLMLVIDAEVGYCCDVHKNYCTGLYEHNVGQLGASVTLHISGKNLMKDIVKHVLFQLKTHMVLLQDARDALLIASSPRFVMNSSMQAQSNMKSVWIIVGLYENNMKNM